jgi:hypothetical protein
MASAAKHSTRDQTLDSPAVDQQATTFSISALRGMTDRCQMSRGRLHVTPPTITLQHGYIHGGSGRHDRRFARLRRQHPDRPKHRRVQTQPAGTGRRAVADQGSVVATDVIVTKAEVFAVSTAGRTRALMQQTIMAVHQKAQTLIRSERHGIPEPQFCPWRNHRHAAGKHSGFAADEIAPRAEAIDRDNLFPADLWRKLGAWACSGITAEEEYGGTGLGYLAHIIAMEEISRASASVALSYGAHSNLCVNQIVATATRRRKPLSCRS